MPDYWTIVCNDCPEPAFPALWYTYMYRYTPKIKSNQSIKCNVARITRIQSPWKRNRYVNSYSKMSGNDWWNEYVSLVCGRNRSGRRMTEYQEASCSRESYYPLWHIIMNSNTMQLMLTIRFVWACLTNTSHTRRLNTMSVKLGLWSASRAQQLCISSPTPVGQVRGMSRRPPHATMSITSTLDRPGYGM